MLDNLYREVIIYYSKNPVNFGLIKDDKSYKEVHLLNPSCGDDITIQIKVEDNKIKDIRQQGKGCTICCSSASILTLQVKDKNIDFVEKSVFEFLELVKGNEIEDTILIKEAKAFKGVSTFPARVRCASISWKALEQALKEV